MFYFPLLFLSFVFVSLATHSPLQGKIQLSLETYCYSRNLSMQNFIRVSRNSTHTMLRTVIQANNSSNSTPPLSFTHKPATDQFSSHGNSSTGISNANSSLTSSKHHFRFHPKLSQSKYDTTTKVVPSWVITIYLHIVQKYILIGLGSEVLIELCAEGLFFEIIPYPCLFYHTMWTIHVDSLEKNYLQQYHDNDIGQRVPEAPSWAPHPS